MFAAACELRIGTTRPAGRPHAPAGSANHVMGREKQGSSHATSGFAMTANPGLSARSRITRARKVFPAASMGETHASNGWPLTAALGLREAWTAQRNGSTAIRNMIG